MIIRDAHQSGHAIATPSDDQSALAGIANAATVGVLTEAVGVRMLEGWSCRGGETKVVWNDAKWEHVDSGTESVPTPPWKRGNSHRTTVDVEWVLLRHIKTGILLLRLGGHLPAHLFKSAQRAANDAALQAIGPIVLALIATHSPDVVTASFDLNRAVNTPAQRRIVETAIEGTGLRLIVPPKHTLRLRTIDAFLTTGDLAAAKMLARIRGYDHQGAALASCGCPKQRKETK